MRLLIINAALALTAAAPVFANTQLALSLGVEPGSLSSAELATLKGLREGGDSAEDERPDTPATLIPRGVVSAQNVESAGYVQLAASLDLDSTAFTTAELATIKGILEQRATEDASYIAQLSAEGGTGIASTQSVGISAGHVQLARNLRLNPAHHSLAELASIKGRSELAQGD